MYCLCICSQFVHASSIGVNFATDGSGVDFDLTPTDSTGVVLQSHWNNAHSSDSLLLNLTDDHGSLTGASVSWNNHQPLSTNVAGGTPAGNLLHSAIYCTLGSQAGITVSNIPYTTFDLYIYAAAPGTSNQLEVFKINYGNTPAEQLSVQGIIDVSGGSSFVLSGTSSSGNYLYYGGLTGSTLYLNGSGGAPVDGLQIVQTPEPTSLVLMICAAICCTLIGRRRLNRFSK